MVDMSCATPCCACLDISLSSVLWLFWLAGSTRRWWTGDPSTSKLLLDLDISVLFNVRKPSPMQKLMHRSALGHVAAQTDNRKGRLSFRMLFSTIPFSLRVLPSRLSFRMFFSDDTLLFESASLEAFFQDVFSR